MLVIEHWGPHARGSGLVVPMDGGIDEVQRHSLDM